MKVLTIHNDKRDAADFCWGVEGEIAITPLVCDKPDCGCDRSHTGINSGRGSTTLIVRDVALAGSDFVTATAGYLEAIGGAECLSDSGDPREVDALAGDLVAISAEVAAGYAPGTVLRPRFDRERQEWEYSVVDMRGPR